MCFTQKYYLGNLKCFEYSNAGAILLQNIFLKILLVNLTVKFSRF